jgi:hypothetical protein
VSLSGPTKSAIAANECAVGSKYDLVGGEGLKQVIMLWLELSEQTAFPRLGAG